MNDISEYEKLEIQRYLTWDEKKLFRELDRYYASSSPGGMRASYRVRGKGRVWLHETMPKLREFVCGEWDYDKRKDDPELQDKEHLAAALSEALAPLLERYPFPTGSPVPAYLVASILVHSGLDDLCQEDAT
jgi:hypothetical protein